MDLLEQLSKPGAAAFPSAMTTLVLAFVLAQIVAGVYIITFRGMSYSRSFVQAIPLGAAVPALLMLAIGDSIAAGLRLEGGLLLGRFRNTLRGPRGTVLVLARPGGRLRRAPAALPAAGGGTTLFSLAALLLYGVSFGARRQFDGLVRMVAPADTDTSEKINAALRAHTRHHVLVSLREVAQGEKVEHAYQVKIPDPASRPKLLSALSDVPDVRDISIHMQEPTLEV